MYPGESVEAHQLPEPYAAPTDVAIDNTEKPDITGPMTMVIESGEMALLPLPEPGVDMKAALKEIERGWIDQALTLCEGNVSAAARRLGIQRTTLIEKMRKLDIRSAP